jgi:hypothetical protein
MVKFSPADSCSFSAAVDKYLCACARPGVPQLVAHARPRRPDDTDCSMSARSPAVPAAFPAACWGSYGIIVTVNVGADLVGADAVVTWGRVCGQRGGCCAVSHPAADGRDAVFLSYCHDLGR